jgi:biopolymer transport protein ExbD
MRLSIFFCIILWTSCSGQQTKVEQTQIDTLKLFDPRPDKIEVNFMPLDIYKNCIAIKNGFFVIVTNEIQNRFDTEIELANYIKTHTDEINKKKFYVLYDSSTSFKQIVSTLDLLKNNQLDNYRVIDMDKFFKIPPPAVIQAPTLVSNKVDKNDSTNFIITILEKSIRVNHLKTINNFANAIGLDNFITKHKNEIDSSKIIVASIAKTPYTSFKPVKEVLKKHKYFAFKIIIDEQNE